MKITKTNSVAVFGADCRDTMRQWAAHGVKAQTCITSPPYFGLRDYGVEGQLGLEQTPEEYVTALVEVFRCVWGVLADDGTLWINIGDSYAGSGKGPAGNLNKKHNERQMSHTKATKLVPEGCKPKDLIGIPWALAFALRADGWYLRQDIVWSKPNPMPESVKDRCTKAHEYVFLLSKKPKYYFDSAAMQENDVGNRGLRNRRSVWTVTTKPFKGAHFATFPPELIEPCVLAGSKKGDLILDPFMGSGTTAGVALKHGRRYLGCELNAEYQRMHNDRIIRIAGKDQQNTKGDAA